MKKEKKNGGRSDYLKVSLVHDWTTQNELSQYPNATKNKERITQFVKYRT